MISLFVDIRIIPFINVEIFWFVVESQDFISLLSFTIPIFVFMGNRLRSYISTSVFRNTIPNFHTSEWILYCIDSFLFHNICKSCISFCFGQFFIGFDLFIDVIVSDNLRDYINGISWFRSITGICLRITRWSRCSITRWIRCRISRWSRFCISRWGWFCNCRWIRLSISYSSWRSITYFIFFSFLIYVIWFNNLFFYWSLISWFVNIVPNNSWCCLLFIIQSFF